MCKKYTKHVHGVNESFLLNQPDPCHWGDILSVFLISQTSSALLDPCWTLRAFFYSIIHVHVLKPGFTYKSSSTLHTQLLKHLRNLNKCKWCSTVGLESTKKSDRISKSNHNISSHLSWYCCLEDSHFAIRLTGLSVLKHNVNFSITSWAGPLLVVHSVQTGSVSSSLSLSILFISTEGHSGDWWSETEQ